MIERYLFEKLIKRVFQVKVASIDVREMCNQKNNFNILEHIDFVHASNMNSSMTFLMDNEIISPVNVSNWLPVLKSKLLALIIDHFQNANLFLKTKRIMMRIKWLWKLTQ